MPVNIRQAAINPIMSHRQTFVINPHQVQNGGMDIINLGWIFAIQGLVPPLVGFAVSQSAPHTPTT